jgi:hypothetical protein
MTMKPDDIAYLNRAFQRLCDETIEAVQSERTKIMANAAKHGALQSGGMLLSVKNEYIRAAGQTADKMVKLAFELTGSTAQPVSDTVERGLRSLRDALSNDLAQCFGVQGEFAGSNGGLPHQTILIEMGK